MIVGGAMVVGFRRLVQEPMFASVEGFGKAGSVGLPLAARSAIANSKRQGGQVANASATRRQDVVLGQVLPFGTKGVSKQVPILTGRDSREGFAMRECFVEILL